MNPGTNAPGAKTATFCALLKRPECSQLFILYCGQAGAFMMDPTEFIARTRIVDRNLAIVRDVNGGCYQRGINGDISDIPSFIDWQRQMLQDFPKVRSVYCVGSSGGAYAAVLSGYFLQATAVWAFAPTIPLVEDPPRLQYVDPRFSDLSRLLAKSNGKTKYRVYFNSSHAPDQESAAKLSGLPDVKLCPQPGEGHGVIVHLSRTQQLGTMMPPFEKA